MWWHQQQNHRIEHAEAAALASASTNQLALIPYNAPSTRPISERSLPDLLPKQESSEDPLEYIKQGDLEAVRKAVQASCPSTFSALFCFVCFSQVFVYRMVIHRQQNSTTEVPHP